MSVTDLLPEETRLQLVSASDDLEPEPPAGLGAIRVLDAKGDSSLTWNPNDPAEVRAARKYFDRFAKEKGYAAFRVAPGGGPGDRMTDFDPAAGAFQVVLAPPIRGGAPGGRRGLPRHADAGARPPSP